MQMLKSTQLEKMIDFQKNMSKYQIILLEVLILNYQDFFILL